MDRKLKAETLALLLLFAAFPIISFGTIGDRNLVWWIGLLSLVAGGVLPVWTRYMDHSGDTIRDVGLEFDDRTS
ncbi:EmrB/QacA subfamily drug resistance transporter [Microvirga sp. TS319]|uniref:EmrB/QacA subfamily drug resistance transporter n=1 Tax=Microvirga sp. TS319 TaxID=3241165 RepID=UPI00351A76A0